VEEIQIRAALVTDAEGISALIQSLLQYRAEGTPAPPSAEFAAQFQPETLAPCIVSDNHRYAVATDDGGALVGVIGVRDNRHLLHLFVAESHHRRGIARALWLAAKAAVLAVTPEVEMTVRSSLHATAVYRRFGFTDAGPRVDLPGLSFVPMRLQLGTAAEPGSG